LGRTAPDDMKRVRLKNIALGDPDDVEIYAGAAIWDWMQKPEFERLKEFNITADQMTWTRGVMLPHSITVDVWTEVEDEVAALLLLSGLCQS
jgi:hypothetical protein